MKNSDPSQLSNSTNSESSASTVEIDLENYPHDHQNEINGICQHGYPKNSSECEFCKTLHESNESNGDESSVDSSKKTPKKLSFFAELFQKEDVPDPKPCKTRDAMVEIIRHGFLHLDGNEQKVEIHKELSNIKKQTTPKEKSKVAKFVKNTSIYKCFRYIFMLIKIFVANILAICFWNSTSRSSLSNSLTFYHNKTWTKYDTLKGFEMNEENDKLYYLHQKVIEAYINDPRFEVLLDPENDKNHPRNWVLSRKLKGTIILAIAAMYSQLGSSIIAPISFDIQNFFRVDKLNTSLACTIYFLGMGVGPFMFGPLSELFGRKPAVLLAVGLNMIFCLLCGYSLSFPFLLFTRFFSGFSASGPIVISGGAISDLWCPGRRAIFLTINSLAIALGPTTGFLFGNLIRETLSWRWVLWSSAIGNLLILFCIATFVPETYAPVILKTKSEDLRMATGNRLYFSALDLIKVDIGQLLISHIIRPAKMATVPIIFLICCYNGLSFGLYYMTSITVSEKFQTMKHWSPLKSALPPLAIFVGALLGSAINLFVGNYVRMRMLRKKAPVSPFSRLVVPVVTSWFLPVGLNLYGWTIGRTSNEHWVFPCLGLVFIGAGFFITLQSSLNFLCDAFQKASASCIAANAFIRSLFACLIPIISPSLFDTFGMDIGFTLLGGISLMLIICVVLINRYGPNYDLQAERFDFLH